MNFAELAMKERKDLREAQARAEAAEARAKVLEDALQRIASKTTDPYADSEALTALAAKEKP